MEIRRSRELAGVARDLYAAMGSGDPGAVEAFYSLRPHAVFLDRPTIELASSGRFETRLTLVFHREDGAWKVVHAHTSVGQEREG